MVLELAEGGSQVGYLPEESPYIYLPGGEGQEGVYVREDMFDHLPTPVWNELMAECAGVDRSLGLFGLTKKSRERIAARRDERTQRKLLKIGARGEAKAVARGGGEGVVMKGLKGVISTAGNAIGGAIGGGNQPQMDYIDSAAADLRPDAEKEWIKGVPNAVTGIGAALLVVGGIYLATKKK